MNMRHSKARKTLNKDELLEIIKGLLGTDVKLDFLLRLGESELETLVVCVRERLDQSS
jgi:hypothetical protein